MTAKTTPAADSTPVLEFTETDIPVTPRGGRTSDPNPFLDVVKGLPPNTKALSVLFDGKPFDSDGKNSEAVRKAKRQLQAAGKEHGVSVLTATHASNKSGGKVETKEATHTRLVFWTVPRITRNASK